MTVRDATHAGRARGRAPADRIGALRLGRFSGVYLWLLFIAVYAVWIPDTFLTATTAQTIASEQAITLVLALAALITLSAGQFDLSIAQNLGFGAALCIVLLEDGAVPVIAVALTIAACTAVGVVNAGLVALLGIESLIATLGMSSVLLALTGIVTGNEYVGPAPPSFSDFVSQQPLGVPILAVYALAAALVVWYALEHTPMGRRVYATGANAETARLAGVPVRRYVAGSLIVAGFISGVAAVLLAAKLGTVSPQIGPPFLLPTFAAVFLSATQIKPGRFNVWGMVLALYLLGTGVKGLVLAGGQLWITDLFNGVALLAAVGLALYFGHRREARATRRASADA